LLVLALAWIPAVEAAFTITVTETGGNVVATGSGSLNTTSLAVGVPGNAVSFVEANAGSLYIGPTALTAVVDYSGATGPASFGAGVFRIADSGAGDIAGIDAGDTVIVPAAYVSGTPLSGSATWNATTFAGLGLTPGTYTWTWGAGATADSLTVQIGPVAAAQSIPTLSEWGMVVLSILLVFATLLTLRRQRT
jgi:hypothetical protein